MSIESIVESRNRRIGYNIESAYYNLRGIREELAKPNPDFESINTHCLHIDGYIYEISGWKDDIKALHQSPDKSVIEAECRMLEELVILKVDVRRKYNRNI